MNDKIEARWILVLLAAKGIEATGELLLKFWKRSTRQGRLDTELRRLEQAGKIGRSGSGPVDARLFRLTPTGRKAVFGSVDPEALWARPWDGRWRFVLFDVPQSRARLRSQLRRTIKQLRFGWLQNSVWISPDSIGTLTDQLRDVRASAESLLFIEGRPAGGESDADLVAGAWDFARLAKLHASYLKLLQLRPGAGRRASITDWVQWLRTEDRAWREIVRHDPFLPEALLPADYAGRAAWSARVEALSAAGQALGRASERG